MKKGDQVEIIWTEPKGNVSFGKILKLDYGTHWEVKVLIGIIVEFNDSTIAGVHPECVHVIDQKINK